MKTLLVIGSGPGIGLATAQRFSREGYRIVLTSRNLSNLQAQAFHFPSGVTLMEADASKPAQIAELAARLAAEGALTILYNAGVLRYDDAGQLKAMSIVDHSVSELQSDMAINLTSVLVAIRSAVPAMAERGEGSILITGGGFGIHPSPDFLPLSAGKAGIRATAQGLFEPLKKQGIHIGTVTVSRLVSPDSAASREIADLFWKMESAPVDEWTWEEHYG